MDIVRLSDKHKEVMDKKLTIIINEELHKDFKKLGIELNSSMKNMFCQAMREFIKKYGKKKG